MAITRRDFVRTLFAASQVAVAGKLISTPLYADTPPAGAMNFAIIGDWGRRGRPDQAQVAQQMAAACQDVDAGFVISVGDNFYEDGVASLSDPHWQQSFENVYSAPSLHVPWFVILGNHDYHANTDAQLQYGKAHSRWIMPARYYTKVMRLGPAAHVEFFFIDTSPMIGEYQNMPIMASIHQQDVPAQLAWLDQALGASKAQWKIVMGHHPIYSAGSGHGDQQDMITNILPLLRKHNVPAYFSGHDHDLQHLSADGIELFISGGGSEHRPVLTSPYADFGQAASGFAMASLTEHELQVRFIDNTGALLHSAKVARRT
jgi:acid phosphatase